MRSLGFDGLSFDTSPLVTALTRGGAAQQAGLQIGDRLVRVRLPELDGVATARTIMQFSGRSLALDMADGRTLTWSIDRLPERSLPVHPTQIYSSINAALLFFFLWVYYPFRRHDGEVFVLLLTLYPITRILLEIIRTDEPGLWGSPLTISQWVSVGLLIAAGVLWIAISRARRPLSWNTSRAASD